MNTRQKGARTALKARRYAEAHGWTYLAWHQPPRWATEQPFDALLLRSGFKPVLLEVRSNRWGVDKPQTQQLAALPGLCIRQIWRFRDGTNVPNIRQWDGHAWQPQEALNG